MSHTSVHSRRFNASANFLANVISEASSSNRHNHQPSNRPAPRSDVQVWRPSAPSLDSGSLPQVVVPPLAPRSYTSNSALIRNGVAPSFVVVSKAA